MTHNPNTPPSEQGDKPVVTQRARFAEFWKEIADRADIHTDDDEEDAACIGRRDGFEEAVQLIDQLTGGDGEYRFSTDPDRNCPTPIEMVEGILARFEQDTLSREGREAPWGHCKVAFFDDGQPDCDVERVWEAFGPGKVANLPEGWEFCESGISGAAGYYVLFDVAGVPDVHDGCIVRNALAEMGFCSPAPLSALSASEGRDVGREALDRSWPDCLDPNAAHNRRPKRYRKTALIEAVQWFKDGDHPAVRMSDDIREAMVAGHAVPWIETLEGGHIVTPGDWIATGMKGEHWSIKPDVFAATYEEALSTPPAPEHPDMVGGKEGHSEAREALDELEAHEAALTKYRSGDA